MSLVSVVEARYPDVVIVARNMRELDAEEIWPVTRARTPEDLALSIVSGGKNFVALYGESPVAAWGAVELRPKVVSVWMFATDQWTKVSLSVTRQIKRELIPFLIECGCVRAECWTHYNHHVAHRWLAVLGAAKEATVEDYGQNRVPYHCYSWTISRLERENVYRNVYAEDAEPRCPIDASAATSTRTSNPAHP